MFMGVNVSQSDNGVARQYQRSLVGHRDSLREKRREKQTEGGSGEIGTCSDNHTYSYHTLFLFNVLLSHS